jgi:hypothetical protein
MRNGWWDTVGRFFDEKVLPIIGRHFEGTFPRDRAGVGIARCPRVSIHGYDCAGLNSICYG